MAKLPEKISILDKKIDRIVLRRLSDMLRTITSGLERELKILEGELPFRGMRTSRAIEQIVREKGEPMTPFELMELLIEGGSAVGDTDDPQTNTNRAIKQGANEGYLSLLPDGSVTVPELAKKAGQ